MSTVERIQALKKKVEDARRRRNVEEGKLAAHMKALQDMGYSTIEEAEAALSQLEKDITAAREARDKLLEELESQFAELSA